MVELGAISILVDDPSVLAALKFALTIEGFRIDEGVAGDTANFFAGALVVDERYLGDGIASLAQLRSRGWRMPAIILSTNPSARLRERVNAVQGELVEKPLLDDALSGAIRRALDIEGNDMRQAELDGLAPYKRTPTFTEETIPAGLLGEHSTKEGVWGLIHVTSGQLRYHITDPRRERSEQLLTPESEPGLVVPTLVHRVEPVGNVEFFVEFWRAPETVAKNSNTSPVDA